MTFERNLTRIEDISEFCESVLKINVSDDLCKKIQQCELDLIKYHGKNTLNNIDCRFPKYKNESDRFDLRNTIIDELFCLEILDDDDNINLGEGGAKPKFLKCEKKVVIIIGPPASGKSTIALKIANSLGAYVLDSDFAKRKIPEYYSFSCGASIVHDESDEIIFGEDENQLSLFSRCIVKSANLVIPKIGSNVQNILKMANTLTSLDYEVSIILVSLDRKISTNRAIKRFERTGRYLPLSLIYDLFGNDPIITFYRLLNKINCSEHKIISFGKISTLNLSPAIIYQDKLSLVNIFN